MIVFWSVDGCHHWEVLKCVLFLKDDVYELSVLLLKGAEGLL